jgi:pimeloyl-ACP methyl ester carboxylesterase
VAQRALFALADKQPFDWTTNLGSFDPTVLFLRGSLNEVANLEHQQELASSYPHHEMVTMEGVGHAMSWERPVEYLEHVRAYFERIGFTGGAR